jgi:hypothetical protein
MLRGPVREFLEQLRGEFAFDLDAQKGIDTLNVPLLPG